MPAADDHGVVRAVIGVPSAATLSGTARPLPNKPPIMLADMLGPFDMETVQWSALAAQPLLRGDAAARPEGLHRLQPHLFPINFDDFEAEYWHLLNHVTLWDVAVERNVEVTGPDGFRFAQLLTCRDLTRAVGQGKYVLITAPDGGSSTTRSCCARREHVLVRARGQRRAAVREGLAGCGDGRAALEVEAYPLQIQGPKSKDVVRDLFGDDILDLRYYHFRRLELDASRSSSPDRLDVGGRIRDLPPRRLARNGPVGPDHGSGRRTRSGRRPVDIRRVEGGIFNWGADMTYENNPFELGSAGSSTWTASGFRRPTRSRGSATRA